MPREILRNVLEILAEEGLALRSVMRRLTIEMPILKPAL